MQIHQYYLSMIEAVDSEIGRLISSSRKKFSTILQLFLSDNRPNQVAQQYNLGELGDLYRGGISIPMIISGNQLVVNEEKCSYKHNRLISTISELCGIENSKMNDSKSFKSLSAMNLAQIQESIFIQKLAEIIIPLETKLTNIFTLKMDRRHYII